MADLEIEDIPLKKPIKVTLKRAGQEEGEETITTLQLHEFRARDLRAIDGLPDTSKGSILLALMARMCRQPILVIDDLGPADFKVVAEKVQSFMPDGLVTGETV